MIFVIQEFETISVHCYDDDNAYFKGIFFFNRKRICRFGRNIHNQGDIKYIKNIKRYPHVAKAIQLKHCTIIWNLNSFILSIF